jgi:formyl-CoA transferase
MSDQKTSGGALAGIRIVDLTRVLGGPYATQLLGDHGAEIVKIEPPQGDEVRDWGPPFHEGDASYFIGVNRNKRSLGLDLSKAEGRAVLLRLLEEADVLIENYKPGTMEKWGIGYEVLKETFPTLIHCRISGFGGDGPLGGRPGYDAIIQAMVGMFSVNGMPETGQTRVGIPLVDIGTGLYAANAILMAIIERHRSGLGQYLDMTLYDCGLSLMHPHAANHFLDGRVPGLTGNAHPNISPYEKFRTATVEIFIAAGNNATFRRLCSAIGRDDLAGDPRFASNAERVGHRAALTAELEAEFLKEDGEALCDRFMAAGVPAGPLYNTQQVLEHPHTAHRDMRVGEGWYEGTGTPIKFSRTPGGMRSVPPKFGAHSREILAAAGLAADEIEALIEAGVVFETRRA